MDRDLRERSRERLFFTAFFAVLGLAVFGAAPGCETTEGVGEDIEAVGESIDETAEDSGADG